MAGGKSRRMGRDKLFLRVNGVPLLTRTRRVCRDLFAEVYIVARETARFQATGCPVLLDAEGVEGPLAGIITALRHCGEPACFVTAADLRDLDQTVIKRLLEAYAGEQFLGIREPDHCQPLCGIYGVSSLPVFLEAAGRGEYALHIILQDLDCRYIEHGLKVWRNVNSPVDLADQRDGGKNV